MITLPHPPRRIHLKVFASTLGAWAGAVAWLLLAGLLDVERGVLLVPIGLAAGLLGSLWTQPWLFPYRATSKVARVFAGVARTWISFLVFAVVFAVGRVGASWALGEPGRNGSSWTPVPDRSRLRVAGAPVAGGLAAVTHWIRESGHWWVAPLLPLFLVLRTLDAGPDTDAPPANTYTLF